ncbi:MAG: hypothetical protein JRI77_11920, partial [Deltaproteobacteria bacterium]|nr:hypothetical protein [Deltaproteobacteria bacterium]
QPFKKIILQVGILFCSAFIVVLPVTIRNYVKLKEFVLVTADAGKVFYHGNAKGASALEGIALKDEGFAEEAAREPDYAHVLFRITASRLSGKELSASQSSRFWARKALNDILSEPTAYLIRQLKKMFYFFNDYEMHYIASAYKEYKTTLGFPYIRYGVIASLSLLGMALSLRSDRSLDRLFLIYGIIFVYVVSGLLFLVQSRYRTPVVPYLSLFGGYGVFRIKKMIEAKNYKPAALSIIVIGMLFVITRFVYRAEILKMEHWQTATKINYQLGARVFYQRGRYQDAIAELNKCVAMAPYFAPAYNLRGKSYAMLSDLDSAEKDFHRVIQLSPKIAEGYKNLGFLFLLKKNPSKAKSYLLKALSLSPADIKIKDALDSMH